MIVLYLVAGEGAYENQCLEARAGPYIPACKFGIVEGCGGARYHSQSNARCNRQPAGHSLQCLSDGHCCDDEILLFLDPFEVQEERVVQSSILQALEATGLAAVPGLHVGDEH